MNNFQLYLSLIYGVIPYERLNADANIILSYVQMLLIPVIYLVCFGLVKFGSYGLEMQGQCNSISQLAIDIFINIGLCLYLSMHLLTLWRGKKFYIEFQKSLDDIDAYLDKCDKGIVEKGEKKETNYLYYITWVVVIVSFAVPLIYDVRELMHYYKERFFIALMTTHVPYFSSSIVLGQFSFYVSEISKRFRRLNELFERINQESDRKYAPLIIFDIETEVKKELGTKQELKHHNSSTRINKDSDDFNHVVDETVSVNSPKSETNFPDLFKLHEKVLSLSKLTNDEYGPQCVPYMAACFVITIYAIFIQVKVFFVVGGKNRLVDHVALLYLLWSLTTMLVAYLVLRLCYNANGYSQQSALIVHEIMHKKPAFMLSNNVYYNKMKSFTLQYLHWEGYFKFNGLGMFILDYTFIFSAISAATAYLIVLLQFDMTSILKREGLL